MLPIPVSTPHQHGEQDILPLLRRIFVMLGLSEKQMPSFTPAPDGSQVSEASVLIHYIKKYYWNISLERIEHAFILHVQEELIDYGAPSICGVFSCAYFSKVLKAYFNWMKAHGEVQSSFDAMRMSNRVPPSRQLTNAEETDWSDFLKQEHTSILTIPVACYEWLVKTKSVPEEAYREFLSASLATERAKVAAQYMVTRMRERAVAKVSEEDKVVINQAKKLFVLHYLNSQKDGADHNS